MDTNVIDLTANPKVQLEVARQKQRQLLGEAELERDACAADGLPLDEPLAKIAAAKQAIENCDGGLAELARRADRATQAEKDAARRIHDAVNHNVRSQIYTLAVEGGGHIGTMRDWGARLNAAVAAGRALGDETLQYQCAELTRGLRYFLGHALKSFPGMDTGQSAFLHLDERTYSSMFPDPATSTPAKKKAKCSH